MNPSPHISFEMERIRNCGRGKASVAKREFISFVLKQAASAYDNYDAVFWD
jgi:hypothetical protein